MTLGNSNSSLPAAAPQLRVTALETVRGSQASPRVEFHGGTCSYAIGDQEVLLVSSEGAARRF